MKAKIYSGPPPETEEEFNQLNIPNNLKKFIYYLGTKELDKKNKGVDKILDKIRKGLNDEEMHEYYKQGIDKLSDDKQLEFSLSFHKEIIEYVFIEDLDPDKFTTKSTVFIDLEKWNNHIIEFKKRKRREQRSKARVCRS